MAKAQIPDLTSTSSLGSSDEVMIRQGVSDKRIRLQLSEILAWATRNGYNYVGDYTTDPELTSTDDFAVYSGLVYFGASGLSYPYTIDSTTYSDPDSDTNLLRVFDYNSKSLNIDPSTIGDYGVPTLDSSFKIKSSDLPPIAITSVTVVTSEAEMIALTAEEGDVAVINTGDLSTQKTYIRNSGTSGTISDWTQLLTDAGFLTDIVYDTTPQLGGDLDLNGYKISTTNHGAAATALTVLSESDWTAALGYSTFVDPSSTGYPSTLTTNYGYWNVLGKRDLQEGYSGIFIDYITGRTAIGYNVVGTGSPSWNYLYSSANTNIGTGSTNYAAGDHTHDADEVSAPALLGFTTDASEGSTTLTASHFNLGTIFNQTSSGEKSFTLPAGLTGIVGRAIEVLSLSASTYVYFPSGVTLTAYTPDDGGFSGGGGVYSTYVRASYSFQYFKIICVADDEYAVVGYMRYT